MKTILTMMEVKDEDLDFYVNELQHELDEPSEDACILTAYQVYEEDEKIPDIMKRETFRDYLLRYGNIRADVETEEKDGVRRIRVIEFKGVIYFHQMFNGEVIECYEV